MKYSSYIPTVLSNPIGLFCSFLLLCCISNNVLSAGNRDQNEALQNHFKAIISDINQTLKSKHKLFQRKPTALANYVDKRLISIWSSSKTLSGFLGKNAWQSVKPNKRQDLIEAINNTLQRYSQEGVARYEGQQIEFVKLRLNRSKSRGFLTIRLIPNSLPSFEFDLKIANIESRWILYDVMLEGISYISIKKDIYRKILKEQGVNALIRFFRNKNKGYIPSEIKERGAGSGVNQERGARSEERNTKHNQPNLAKINAISYKTVNCREFIGSTLLPGSPLPAPAAPECC